MNPEAMRPHGQALLDYHRGNHSATVTIIRDDGKVDPMPASQFYREAESFEMEHMALALCRGKVLDAGAGTGIHTLYLQNKGFTVTAIDVIPEAVQIMKERGVSNVSLADIMKFSGDQFDTILMMGHGIGMVENIVGLDSFLEHARNLVASAGQILLTSLDTRTWTKPPDLEYKQHLQPGRYVGEIRIRFKYKDIEGPFFGWLHVDPETLKAHAEQHGWVCNLVSQQDDGNYLARLVRKPYSFSKK